MQRFREGFTAIPAMRTLGELWDRDVAAAAAEARRLGEVIARELRAHGIDFSFTPVLDVDFGTSGVIGDRALSANPNAIAHLAACLRNGLHAGGCAAVGKHFPGHGFVAADSHHEVPVDERPLERAPRARPRAVRGARQGGPRGRDARARRSTPRSTTSPRAIRGSGSRTSCASASTSTGSSSPTTSAWRARTRRATSSRAPMRRSPPDATWCSPATSPRTPTNCCRAGDRSRRRGLRTARRGCWDARRS